MYFTFHHRTHLCTTEELCKIAEIQHVNRLKVTGPQLKLWKELKQLLVNVTFEARTHWKVMTDEKLGLLFLGNCYGLAEVHRKYFQSSVITDRFPIITERRWLWMTHIASHGFRSKVCFAWLIDFLCTRPHERTMNSDRDNATPADEGGGQQTQHNWQLRASFHAVYINLFEWAFNWNEFDISSQPIKLAVFCVLESVCVECVVCVCNWTALYFFISGFFLTFLKWNRFAYSSALPMELCTHMPHQQQCYSNSSNYTKARRKKQ